MLRLLIGTGVVLMVVGFGTAGWQYWQSVAGADPAIRTAAGDVSAIWLGGPNGDIVPAETAAAFLAQDRFVPARLATITFPAALTGLLREGEPLPDPAFLEVMADIRAPRLAEGLCPVLTGLMAEECAVHSARVVPGSVNPTLGTAQFRIELAYRLLPDGAELPDLAEHIFDTSAVEVSALPENLATDTVGVALAAVIEAGQLGCTSDNAGSPCRIIALTLDWRSGSPFHGIARIGWLAPLPDGVFAAPEIGPATGG